MLPPHLYQRSFTEQVSDKKYKIKSETLFYFTHSYSPSSSSPYFKNKEGWNFYNILMTNVFLGYYVCATIYKVYIRF